MMYFRKLARVFVPIVALMAAAPAAAQPAGSTIGKAPVAPSKAHGKFCTGELVLDQEPNLSGSFWSEATCDACSSDGAQILAEDFLLQGETLITEIVVWGWYWPDNIAPPLEHWTVIFHPDTDAALPGEGHSSQMVTATRVATGRSADILGATVDEHRWLLRLAEPVRLGGGIHWVQVYHDSPALSVLASIGFADEDEARGEPGHAESLSAPGADWFKDTADLALQICGVDARWSGLLVPRYEVDTANPDVRTLIAVRNTSANPLNVDVTYYGERLDNGPVLSRSFQLAPEQTLTRDVGTDLAAVLTGQLQGFAIISESSGGAENLVGDFSRVDFANDFATGDRMAAFGDFCVSQEIRAVDFGSGSDFNIILRDLPTEGPAFSYRVVDEAGNAVTQGTVSTGSNVVQLPIENLAAGLSFGTLIFDFSLSQGGVITGAYSAFGRFSTEVAGACRD